MNSNLPIVYTFRRCPYAMRARLVIELTSISVEYREILLRNKPKEMLKASSKGTVPVLITSENTVIDESLDIIFWSLRQNDPFKYLTAENLHLVKNLIAINDHDFKPLLDKYKYAVRFPENSEESYRDSCRFFLQKLNSLLTEKKFLFSAYIGLADLAIFPFIRQFAFVDKNWFDSTEYNHLQRWLNYHLESELFKNIMIKKEFWAN